MLYLKEWANYIFSGKAGNENYSTDIHIDNILIQNLNFPLCMNGSLDYEKLTSKQILSVSYELFYQLVKLCADNDKLNFFNPLLRIELPSCNTLTRYNSSILEDHFIGFTPPSLFLCDRREFKFGVARKGIILTETITQKYDELKLLDCDVHSFYETYFDSHEPNEPYRREVYLEVHIESEGDTHLITT